MFNVNSFDSQGNSFEVSCYDFKGNHIDHLTQWDVNQELYVEHWDYEYTPVFNFCNIKSKNALVVKGSIEPDGRAKCIIPNILLTEPYSISVFVCFENDTFGRTVHISQIPVLKKLKPNEKMKIIGITGSHGKSSVAYLLNEYMKLLHLNTVMYSSIMIDSKNSKYVTGKSVEVPIKDEKYLII